MATRILICIAAISLFLAVPAHGQFSSSNSAAQNQYGPTPTPTPSNPPSSNPPPSNPPGGGSGPGGSGNQPASDAGRGNEDDDPRGSGALPSQGGGNPGPGGGGVAPGGGGGALPTRRSQGANLPYTGLDLTTIASLGFLLLGLGLGLTAAQRIAARRRSVS